MLPVCDVGIYVSPGPSYVTITSTTVTGAGQHGIFVQDDSHVAITHNFVFRNGVAGMSLSSSGTSTTRLHP